MKEDIIDILRSIVSRTSDQFIEQTQQPNNSIEFLTGHVKTVVNRLTDMMKVDQKRFPLFAVYRPFEIPVKPLEDGTFRIVLPKCILATITTHELIEEQRYEINFKPILYPIMDLFQKNLTRDKRIFSFNYSTIDVPYYSEDNQKTNVYNEKVDGIIIKNLTLKIYKNYCL